MGKSVTGTIMQALTMFGFFLKILFYLFLERGEGRDKDRERSIDVREKHQWVASTGD